MRPPPRTSSTTFEKVQIGEFILGTIDKIEYDTAHKFKGFEGKEDSIAPALRFVFKLQGYEWPHRSRWMRFTLGEKSNLYKKYVSKLVMNAVPDMDFDLDQLKGMQIKTLWEENGEFQNLESIFPIGQKLAVTDNEINEPPPPMEDDFIPEIEENPY
jgi:hypothetical protein